MHVRNIWTRLECIEISDGEFFLEIYNGSVPRSCRIWLRRNGVCWKSKIGESNRKASGRTQCTFDT
jgi:hypothetical protein